MGILYVKDYETGEYVPIASIQGATGPKGPKGAAGPQGPNGKDGADGAPGKDGADGAPGKDGRGITSIVWVNATQSLTIHYTDGTSQTVATGLPDLSGYKPQRIVTSEPADSAIAEGEIVWIGEVVT